MVSNETPPVHPCPPQSNGVATLLGRPASDDARNSRVAKYKDHENHLEQFKPARTQGVQTGPNSATTGPADSGRRAIEIAQKPPRTASRVRTFLATLVLPDKCGHEATPAEVVEPRCAICRLPAFAAWPTNFSIFAG